ncbi:hypothetical protein ABT115_24075 [Streptomyces sp. NPDC001832]|uniref:hypothetical protein n=1 Tax=Streptomyces sp. NPDC001832 TaxID=3154527 RepID=UPI0033255218
MADEHYEWLDEDAAERLLRGEPVDPVGGDSCTEAERLAAVLDAARAVRPATGELPGEAAALAAFRAAAHSAHAKTRAANPQAKGHDETGEPVPADVLEPVHIRPASGGFAQDSSTSSAASGRTRSLGRSRPVRFGLVASFAGCALGGVAVAASTGMLPGPFGGHTPVPAATVSAAPTPGELGSGGVTDVSPSAPPLASPKTEPSTPPADPSARTGDRGSGRAGEGDDKDEDDRKPDGTASESSNGTEDGHRRDGTENGDRSDDSDSGKQPDGSGNGTPGDWYARTLKACRAYRDGRLDDEGRRYLEALAKGARNLDRFCDRVIAKDTNGQNSPGSDGGGEQSGRGEKSGDGDSNGDSGGSGTLPAIRFTTPPSSSAPVS